MERLQNTIHGKPKPRPRDWTRILSTQWNYPVAHFMWPFEAYTYTREGEKVPRLDVEAFSAFWPANGFVVEEIDPDWELPEIHLRMIDEYSRRLFEWEEFDREEMMASFQTFDLERTPISMEKGNVNEHEGFELYSD
jgi:hypothetical protein